MYICKFVQLTPTSRLGLDSDVAISCIHFHLIFRALQPAADPCQLCEMSMWIVLCALLVSLRAPSQTDRGMGRNGHI